MDDKLFACSMASIDLGSPRHNAREILIHRPILEIDSTERYPPHPQPLSHVGARGAHGDDRSGSLSLIRVLRNLGNLLVNRSRLHHFEGASRNGFHLI